MIMAVSGTWPFEPLEHRTRTINLADGAVIQIHGVEERGWQSDGFIWTASFRPHPDAAFERIGGWIGPNDDLRIYTAGALIVGLNPGRRIIHVRGSNGQWKSFDLRLPGKNESLSEFSRFFPTLAETDLRRFQSDLTEEEAAYSPATDIQEFDPVTLEIRARILTSRKREAVFTFSEDGASVRLASLRRVETPR
jgi:hypothetical protein